MSQGTVGSGPRRPARPGRRKTAARLTVFGVVQGVGFRPCVYRLALRLGLYGWVENAGSGSRSTSKGRPPTSSKTSPPPSAPPCRPWPR
jgi:hypothetical protein